MRLFFFRLYIAAVLMWAGTAFGFEPPQQAPERKFPEDKAGKDDKANKDDKASKDKVNKEDKAGKEAKRSPKGKKKKGENNQGPERKFSEDNSKSKPADSDKSKK